MCDVFFFNVIFALPLETSFLKYQKKNSITTYLNFFSDTLNTLQKTSLEMQIKQD
jgi:hypothetical protein